MLVESVMPGCVLITSFGLNSPGFSYRFWEHFSAYGRWKDLLHRLRAARHSSLRLPPGGSGGSAGHHLRQRHRQGGENVCGESCMLG